MITHVNTISKLIKNYGEIQAMITDWVEKYTHTHINNMTRS